MKMTDVKCPACGTMNYSLYLEETDGLMECERCGCTVQLTKRTSVPLRRNREAHWRVKRTWPVILPAV